MKKIISLILLAFLLFPIGVNAKSSSTETINVAGEKVNIAWYESRWVDLNNDKYLIYAGKLIKGWRFDRDRTNDKYMDLKQPLSKPYWYYFDENGKMIKNVIVDGYIIGSDGKSYLDIDHKDLNRGQNGKFAKTIVPIVPGWQESNGKWYYFNDDLTMAINTITPDGYKVDITGAWIK